MFHFLLAIGGFVLYKKGFFTSQTFVTIMVVLVCMFLFNLLIIDNL